MTLGDFFFRGQVFNLEVLEQFIEDHTVKIVEARPRKLACSNLLHRRLISEAPAICKRRPVNGKAFGIG